MDQIQATILHKETIHPALWRLTVEIGPLADGLEPGKFFLARCADPATAYLRRPLFPSAIGAGTCAFLLHPDPDPGLAWLIARAPGETLDLVGPLGRGFELGPAVRNLLLVSDVAAIGPLLALAAQASGRPGNVVMALGGSRAAGLYPLHLLPPPVEAQVTTLDGSLGWRGSVVDLLPDLLRWADAVCCLGTPGLYRELRGQIESVRFRLEPGFAQALVTGPPLHGCGVGSCLACVVPVERGYRLACVDGPVFDLAALRLEEG